MLEFLILLPLIMVSILSMTFQVSVDEISNASRGNYFSYDVERDERVARMMEDSESEIGGSKKGPTCDIQRIQSMNRLCSCGKPRKQCVPIEHPTFGNSMTHSLPQCAFVDRCEGLCPPGRHCKPTAKETVTIPVIFVNQFPWNGPECTTVTVEKHLKCKCSCTTTKEECSLPRNYNPSTCTCQCEDIEKEKECRRSGKHWDRASCECVCPLHIHRECSTGAMFHPEFCRCVQLDTSSGNRRRRPPV